MDIAIRLTKQANIKHYGTSVVTLDLEKEYLPRCISHEIYESESRTPMESKKAQAISARTYAIQHMMSGNTIDDTSKYQAFEWIEDKLIPNCIRACEETSGQVLTYDKGIITAWYSNSNGGTTKRSDQAWSTFKPWTVNKDDSWDKNGRKKWGECKSSHSVGMSQIGSAYAAYIGFSHKEILDFYYPGTEILGNYGKENKSIMKTNLELVEHAKKWIGNPYWYGTCCYPCTTSVLNSKRIQYPSHYTDNRMARYQSDIRSGKKCADCIGLIKGFAWMKEDGTVKYDLETDMNTSGLYSKASVKGVIASLPNVPGLIVYKEGHVGVYEGDGNVIEAKGFASGCIRSKLSDTEWTHWIAYPYISYAGYEELLKQDVFKDPYLAIVNTSKTPLNIWKSTDKKESVGQVKKGDTVMVVGNSEKIGWYRVKKGNISGYADGQYLVKDSTHTVVDDFDDSESGSSDVKDDKLLYRAKVYLVKQGLNLRTSPHKTNNTMTLIPLGAIVDVINDDAGNGFAQVAYGGMVGYCSKQYLHKLEDKADDLFSVSVERITTDAVELIRKDFPGAVIKYAAQENDE